MSFVASETPSKTTPESYNRTPYARDGRRNTDTQQVGAWGASLPLRAHHEGAPAQTIPRMQRRARCIQTRMQRALSVHAARMHGPRMQRRAPWVVPVEVPGEPPEQRKARIRKPGTSHAGGDRASSGY